MKIKSGLMGAGRPIFSKKKKVLLESKPVLKQNKLKSKAKLKNINIEEMTKEKLNLVINNTELISKLNTNTQNSKAKVTSFKKQDGVKVFKKTKKASKEKTKPSASSINENIHGFNKNHSKIETERSSKRENKIKKNLSVQNRITDFQRIEKTVKDDKFSKATLSKQSMFKSKNPSTGSGIGDLLKTNKTIINKNKTELNHYAGKKEKNNQNIDELRKKQLNLEKVTTAVTALLKIVQENKTEFLNLAEPIFMEVECIKIPICPTKQLRFKLPHPLANDLSDIVLITADKKGAKIYPDKSADHYTELLAKHNINFIQKVIPLRTVCWEYSQYELRKKLVDQYDIILADATIIKSLGHRLGKHILYSRKMPIPVHLNRRDLKQHFLLAISKTQMAVKGTGHLTTVQVGHTAMPASQVAANILAVTQSLDPVFPGGFRNIRSLDIKTSNSISLPVYYSTVPSSSVETPIEQPKLPDSVEGELSTQLHSNVVVKADGTVLVRRAPEPKTSPIDNSQDDEILKAALEYEKSAKTVRYGESDDSDDQAEAATATMEKKLLKNYNLAKKKVKEGSDEEGEEGEEEESDEEQEESSDEEEPVAPLPIGKRKKGFSKELASVKSPDKKQKKVHQQNIFKGTKQKSEGKKSGQIKTDDQKRGSRGGKKKKMNKVQRKALIKRKKAGK